MRTVIFLGLLAIADAIKPDLGNADFYTAIFIVVAAMDIFDFMLKLEEKKK